MEGEVRAYAVGLEARWRAMLEQLVRRGVELGHLEARTDADQFVFELCGIYLTHHASRRFLRDPSADTRARSAVEALIDRHRSFPPTTSTT